jgi:hypothetical protein
MKQKEQVSEEIRKYMSELGKKGGAKNKEKGPEFFRWVQAHNKKDKKED